MGYKVEIYLEGNVKEPTGDVSFHDKQYSKIFTELDHKSSKNRVMVQNRRTKKK